MNSTTFLNFEDSTKNFLSYYLIDFWRNDCDPRIKNYPLMDTPWPSLSIIIFYLIFSTCLGPRLMKNQKPFVLRGPMLIYNISLVVINLWAFVESFRYLKFGKVLLNFNFPSRTDRSDYELNMIHFCYLYFSSKYIDFLDTIFFVLRKKYNQISLLHLYHHSSVPFFGWITFKIAPTVPGGLLFATLNSLIHVIMYSYYALSSFGPEIQKYLWWKKYITQIQLIQFVIYGVYGIISFKLQSGYPPAFFYLFFVQPPLFFWLFYDFYSKSYKKTSTKQKSMKIN